MPLSWGASAAQLFFPQRDCLLCGELSVERPLCLVCEARRQELQRCAVCASFGQSALSCRDCVARRPAFCQVRAALPYEGELREHLQAFKYQERTWLRRPLAALLQQTFQEHFAALSFDAVIPVPLAPQRLRERGYNQSQLLSKLVAAQLGLPHRPELLYRLKETPPLFEMTREQRYAALRNVFAAGRVQNLQILVIDDIYTSGATMNACSKALLAQGAKAVYGLTVAAGRHL